MRELKDLFYNLSDYPKSCHFLLCLRLFVFDCILLFMNCIVEDRCGGGGAGEVWSRVPGRHGHQQWGYHRPDQASQHGGSKGKGEVECTTTSIRMYVPQHGGSVKEKWNAPLPAS